VNLYLATAPVLFYSFEWLTGRLEERIKNVLCFLHGFSGINLGIFSEYSPALVKKYVQKCH
jgi:hypothetical protein